MWSVERPQLDAQTVYAQCISRVRLIELRNRLIAITPDVVSAADDYEIHAEVASLHALIPTNGVNGVVTTEEMLAVYDQRMAGKTGPGRVFYDQLKMLPAGDRCPFCDQRNVSTLDHFLPKARFPVLAVTPDNLVGACMECNKGKTTFVPNAPEAVYIHPYFDDLGDATWLTAAVIEQDPCGFTFSVFRPAHWDDLTHARVQNQFQALALGRLYATEAARELANIRYNLEMHYDVTGAVGVRDELKRQWNSRRANRTNSWQTAFYRAVSESDWFCGGGYA